MSDKKEAIKIILVKMDKCLHYLMQNVENYEIIIFYQKIYNFTFYLDELLKELDRKEAEK